MKQIALLLVPDLAAKQYLDLLKREKPDVLPVICNNNLNSSVVPSKQFVHIPLGKEQQAIRVFCKKHNYKIVAVINRLSAFEMLHSQLVDEYGVEGPSYKATYQISNKASLHSLMQEHGLAFYRPQTVITELNKVSEELAAVQFPVVIKPFAGSHSRGVYTLFKKSDYDQVEPLLQDHFEQEKSFLSAKNQKKTVLIEQYIYGKQVTPLPYVDDKGKVHIITLVDIVRASDLKKPHMQLLYRTVPSKYPDKIRQKMLFVLQKLATLSGLKSTLLDPEFIVSGKHVYLIEVNVRMGGFRAELVKPAFGLDLPLVSMQLAFGERVTDLINDDKSATACEIWEDESGIVRKIELPKSKQIVASNLLMKPGDLYTAPPIGNKPLGSFYVVDKTDSLAAAKRIRKKVTLELDAI